MSQFSRRSMLKGGMGAGLGILAMLAADPAQAAVLIKAAKTDEPGILDSSTLLDPMNGLTAGTIYRRDVSKMPVVGNSSVMTKALVDLTQTKGYSGGVSTSPNTESYDVPIFLVDSSVAGCHTMHFSAEGYGYTPDPLLLGDIPCPSWAGPGYGNDQEMVIADVATGLVRGYYGIESDNKGGFLATFGGYVNYGPGFKDIATPADYAQDLTTGSYSAVKMNTAFAQVSLMGMLNYGIINGALPFTLPNGAKGSSYPALQGDGQLDASSNLPVEGQWFRLRQDVDVDALGLTHSTRMAAWALQRFGGFFLDRNHWDMALNYENFHGWRKNAESPWPAIGAAVGNFVGGGDPFLDDFPWDLVEFAPIDWKGDGVATDLTPYQPYLASEWNFFTTGKFVSANKANIAKFSLVSTNPVASGIGHTTYTKTFNVAKTGTYDFAVIVDPHDTRQTISAYVNNVKVASISSDAPRGSRSLKVPVSAGKQTIRIQFDIPAGGNPDKVWVWSPTIY